MSNFLKRDPKANKKSFASWIKFAVIFVFVALVGGYIGFRVLAEEKVTYTFDGTTEGIKIEYSIKENQWNEVTNGSFSIPKPNGENKTNVYFKFTLKGGYGYCATSDSDPKKIGFKIGNGEIAYVESGVSTLKPYQVDKDSQDTTITISNVNEITANITLAQNGGIVLIGDNQKNVTVEYAEAENRKSDTIPTSPSVWTDKPTLSYSKPMYIYVKEKSDDKYISSLEATSSNGNVEVSSVTPPSGLESYRIFKLTITSDSTGSIGDTEVTLNGTITKRDITIKLQNENGNNSPSILECSEIAYSTNEDVGFDSATKAGTSFGVNKRSQFTDVYIYLKEEDGYDFSDIDVVASGLNEGYDLFILGNIIPASNISSKKKPDNTDNKAGVYTIKLSINAFQDEDITLTTKDIKEMLTAKVTFAENGNDKYGNEPFCSNSWIRIGEKSSSSSTSTEQGSDENVSEFNLNDGAKIRRRAAKENNIYLILDANDPYDFSNVSGSSGNPNFDDKYETGFNIKIDKLTDSDEPADKTFEIKGVKKRQVGLKFINTSTSEVDLDNAVDFYLKDKTYTYDNANNAKWDYGTEVKFKIAYKSNGSETLKCYKERDFNDENQFAKDEDDKSYKIDSLKSNTFVYFEYKDISTTVTFTLRDDQFDPEKAKIQYASQKNSETIWNDVDSAAHSVIYGATQRFRLASTVDYSFKSSKNNNDKTVLSVSNSSIIKMTVKNEGTDDYIETEGGTEYIYFEITPQKNENTSGSVNISDIFIKRFGITFKNGEEDIDDNIQISPKGSTSGSYASEFDSNASLADFDVKLGTKYRPSGSGRQLKASVKYENEKEIEILSSPVEDGIYRFSNLKDQTADLEKRSDVTITFTNIENNNFSVHLWADNDYHTALKVDIMNREDTDTRYSGQIANTSVLETSHVNNFVPYGEDFKFRVYLSAQGTKDYLLSAGYIKASLEALNLQGVGGIIVDEPDQNNKYMVTIKNVTDHLTNDNSIEFDRLISKNTSASFRLLNGDGSDECGEDMKGLINIYDSEGKEVYKYEKSVEVGRGIETNNIAVDLSQEIKIKLKFKGIDTENGIKCCLTNQDPKNPSNTNAVKESEFTKESESSEDGCKVITYSLDANEVRNFIYPDLFIKISGLKLEQKTITFDEMFRKHLKLDGKESYENKTVGYGGDMVFEVSAKDNTGFVFENMGGKIHVDLTDGTRETEYNISFGESDSEDTFKFVINGIRDNITIKLDETLEEIFLNFLNSTGVEYYSASENGGSYNIGEKISGYMSLKWGESYIFGVKANEGYNIDSIKFRSNYYDDEEKEDKVTFTKLRNADASGIAIYEVTNVQLRNIKINAEIERKKYKVTLSKDENFDITYKVDDESKSSIEAEHGSTVSFSIVLEERCSSSDFKVNVYNSDGSFKETLNRVSGVYKILDVVSDLTVKVENLSLNSYVLNFEQSDYAYFIDETTSKSEVIDGIKSISYGENYTFGVKAKPGYSLGDAVSVQAISSSTGETMTLVKNAGGKYSIKSIKEGYTIKVQNVDTIKYNLTFVPVDGVTYYNELGSNISGNMKVTYGQNFEFSIGVDDAYSDSLQGAYIVTNDSGQSGIHIQKLSSTRYLIQNILQDVKIRVANITKNTYIVTLTKDEGIDYCDKSGKIITGDNNVNHGDNFYFGIKVYPAYDASKIKVMLGNQELSAEDNGLYKIENIVEGRTVTVAGIEKSPASKLIENINVLPESIENDTDLELVLQATRDYNSLSDEQKALIANYYILEALHEKVAKINHTYSGVTAEGLDWNIKIIANPITSDLDACGRIYKSLSNEYILSLYDVYLWDTVSNKRYKLPEGKSVVVHLPTPDLAYFESPTGIHENSNGKVDFLTLNINGSVTSLEASSFSPIGIVAKRSLIPGRSSLIDALDTNVSTITNYALDVLGSGESSSNSGKNAASAGSEGSSVTNRIDSSSVQGEDEQTLDSLEKTAPRVDNSKTAVGSVLRVVLIIMIILIILAIILAFVKKFKDKKDKINEEKK